jgi:hypothetical protein
VLPNIRFLYYNKINVNEAATVNFDGVEAAFGAEGAAVGLGDGGVGGAADARTPGWRC